MQRKIVIVFVGLCAVLSGMSAHLYHLAHTNPAQAASTQNSRAVMVANVRGTIYDRNMQPFVNERSVYYAVISPDERLLAHIRPALDERTFSVVRDQLESGVPAAVRLEEPVALTKGLSLFHLPTRYTERLLAPHIIGYLDAADMNGVTGIEADYNNVLSEYSGSVTVSYAMDGNGRCLNGTAPAVKNDTASSGGGIVLTLDKSIQCLIEDMAPRYLTKGAVVVMDPNSGDILGMASFPSFSPDTVADSIAEDNGALINRALSLYDCGSVFKTVTAAAALEAGISSKQIYECTGAISVGETTFHCHHRLGHGLLSMNEAYAQSCNMYFIQLAWRIGAGRLYSMADSFGFAKAITLTDTIRTDKAVLPENAVLDASPAALANMSFGQGYLMASPLHIAQTTAAIVRDGEMMPPRLVIGTVTPSGTITEAERGRGSRIISSHTAKIVQKMMELVVTDGTGQKAQPLHGTVAGKTGTAETGQVGSGEKPVVQSWFTGYFPVDNPQYVVTILAEDADNTHAQTAKLFCEISDNLMK